jgi:alkylation response protein AidB-like acyl-CoA dehydrogenase
MNFEYSAEQKQEQAAFASFCRNQLAQLPSQIETMPLAEGRLQVRETVRKLGEQGYLGIGLPRQIGGGGRSMLESLPFHQQVAGAFPAAFVSAEASAGMVGGLLSRVGTTGQQEEYLPGIISGTILAAWAATETGAGSDLSAIATSAERSTGGWSLSGTKSMISNAPIADLFVVPAMADLDGGDRGLGLFLVPADTPGVSRGEAIELMGLRGASVGQVGFTRCALPAESLLGAPGDGQALHAAAMVAGSLRYAALAIGLAEICLRLSLDHATRRKIAGRALIQNQEVSFKLADMHTMIDAALQLARYAAWLLDRGDPQAPVLVSCARLLASESATRIAHMAQQIFGGTGYLKANEIERICRDVRFCELSRGAPELQRIAIAESELARCQP